MHIYECLMIMLMLCKSSYARLTPRVLQSDLNAISKTKPQCSLAWRWRIVCANRHTATNIICSHRQHSFTLFLETAGLFGYRPDQNCLDQTLTLLQKRFVATTQFFCRGGWGWRRPYSGHARDPQDQLPLQIAQQGRLMIRVAPTNGSICRGGSLTSRPRCCDLQGRLNHQPSLQITLVHHEQS